MTTASKRSPQQIRDDRNARRRTRRLADTRHGMAVYAASQLHTWSDWSDDHPITLRQVIDKTAALFANHREIRDTAITEAEAAKALTEVTGR